MIKSKIVLLLIFLMAATASWAVTPPTPAEMASTEDAFLLRPGVLVHPTGSRVYLMRPEGDIAAFHLNDGDVEWTTTEAVQPLLLVGKILIAGADSEAGFDLVALDAGNGGRLFRERIALPANVRARLDDGLGKSFAAQAWIDQGRLIVSWSYQETRISGMLEAGASGLPESTQMSGALRLDLATESLEPLDAWTPPAPRRPDLPEEQRLAGLTGVQFVAANDRHVMTSRRRTDDREIEKYSWRLYARDGGAFLGRIANARPQAPFFVSGSVLAYESKPYIHRVGDRMINEPLELRVVGLQDGRELWSQPIRDTAYHGPYPP